MVMNDSRDGYYKKKSVNDGCCFFRVFRNFAPNWRQNVVHTSSYTSR